MTNLVNLTPHAINLVSSDGTVTTVPPSGTILRATSKSVPTGMVNGFVVNSTTFDIDVSSLPPDTFYTDPTNTTVYIVATLVLQALKEKEIFRADFVAPDTSPASAVRNEAGQIIGVKGFQVL